MFSLPTDDNSLYRWLLFLMAAYLVVAYAIRWFTKKRLTDSTHREFLTLIFDSATFSGSVMLLLGIMDPDTLKALGSTKPYLLVAGLAGFIYSLNALSLEKPEKQKRDDGSSS